MTTPWRPYRHVGEPLSIDGVPFGTTYAEGDYYISDAPLGRHDVDIERYIEVLEETLAAKQEVIESMIQRLDGLGVDHEAP